MNIVEVITSANWGGAQRHVYELSCGLRDRGHAVTVCYGEPGPLTAKLETEQIAARRVAALVRTLHPWQDLRAPVRLRQAIWDLHPDVVHVHSSKAGALVRWGLRHCRVPVVYTIHGLVYDNWRMASWKRAFYRAIEVGLLPYATTTICVSRRDFEALAKESRSRRTTLVHLPNALKPPDWEWTWPTVPVVGTVARLTEEKGLDLLLGAVAVLRPEIPGLELLVVGDGPLRQDLERLAETLGIADMTRFVGFQEEVWPWLNQMQVFALPSVKEGMPYSILEAMAALRTIVAADVGGVGEMLEGYAPAFLVRTPRVSDWVEGIRQAVKNVTRGRPATEHLQPMAIGRWIEDYQSALASGSGTMHARGWKIG